MVPRRHSQPGLPSLIGSGGLRLRPSQPPARPNTHRRRCCTGSQSPRRVGVAKRRYAAAPPSFCGLNSHPNQVVRFAGAVRTSPTCTATNLHDTGEGLGAGGTRATRKVTADMHPERRGLRRHVASGASPEQANLKRNTCRTGLPLPPPHSSVLTLHAGALRGAPRKHSGSAR